LEITHAKLGFRCVVNARGEVDMHTVTTLESVLSSIHETGKRDIWVDLSQVEFIDSSGIRALIEAHRAFDRDRRQFALIAPKGPARRVIELTGLDGEVTVFDSRSDAHRLS
jgi:anti-sigma B factor antagonist